MLTNFPGGEDFCDRMVAVQTHPMQRRSAVNIPRFVEGAKIHIQSTQPVPGDPVVLSRRTITERRQRKADAEEYRDHEGFKHWRDMGVSQFRAVFRESVSHFKVPHPTGFGELQTFISPMPGNRADSRLTRLHGFI